MFMSGKQLEGAKEKEKERKMLTSHHHREKDECSKIDLIQRDKWIARSVCREKLGCLLDKKPIRSTGSFFKL